MDVSNRVVNKNLAQLDKDVLIIIFKTTLLNQNWMAEDWLVGVPYSNNCTEISRWLSIQGVKDYLSTMNRDEGN